MNDTKRDSPVLVTGASGKTGRRIVLRLSAKSRAVREGSRWSDPPFDWERRETWPAAFRGVEAVYVSYFPDLAVGAIAEAANRPIGFQEISSEQYAEGMVRARLPKDFVSLVNYLFTTVLDGRDAYLADGVQRALHRKPREFAAYARETVATGIWENQQ